jgi:MFS family permease
MIGLGVVGLAATVYVVRRLLPDGTLRAAPGLPAATAILTLLTFAFFAVEAFLPLALVEVRHAGNVVVATTLTAGTLSWSAGAWVQAHASDVGRRRLLRVGLALVVAGVGATLLPLWPAMSPWSAVAAWTIAGLGMGIAHPVTTVTILSDAPPGREGEVSGTMQIANSLSIAIGTGLGGDLLARFAADGGPIAAGIACVDVAAVVTGLVAIAATRGVADTRPGLQPSA